MNIRDAKICLVCDEIFEGDSCPRCGVDGHYLMTWLRPLYPRPEVCEASSQQRLELFVD